MLADISFASPAGQTTAIIGSTGSGKTTLLNLVPRLFDATVGRGARRRRRRARPGARGAVEPHRPRPAEAVPVLRHGRQQPALRQARRHRRRAVGGARGRAGRATSSRRCRRARRADRAGRHATCRAASGSASPSPGRSCASPRSTCSTTRSRRSTSPPTPACAPRSRRTPPTRRSSSSPSGCRRSRSADQILVLEDGRTVGLGTHHELLETCPTYAEIVASQMTAEEAAA